VTKYPNRILIAATLVAWCFDALFWEKSPGISFAIFITIIVSVGLLLGLGENTKPARVACLLLIPTTIFTLGSIIRKEPLTTFTNILMVLLLLGVFAHTYRNGRWLNYSLSDFGMLFPHLLASSLYKPWEALSKQKAKPPESNGPDAGKTAVWRRVLPYFRGLLIAIPVLTIFGALLAAADPIFEKTINELIRLFKLENLPEYIFRCVYILILGYLLGGIYIHSYTNKKEDRLIGEDKPWLPKFLGFTESVIVIGGVNILFSIFVIIQFTYFFGGNTNINVDGFTYAEYARRGFSELVIVAFFSLLLFLGLSSITRRETTLKRKIFSATCIGLVILVVIILISAYQRLSLYEQVYGFTRLRTYSHIFIIWIGILLALTIVLEFLDRQRAFALAALFTSFGFILSLNLINVDGFIVHQNVKRTVQGEELDAFYFNSLSSDAVPEIIQSLANKSLGETQRDDIRAVLACKMAGMAKQRKGQAWSSYHWSDSHAWRLLKTHREDFSSAKVYWKDDGSIWVVSNGEHQSCQYTPYPYD